METVAKEMDDYGNEPKRIKLENESVGVKLEDSQKCQPQPLVYNFNCHKCPDNFATREEIIHHWTESHGLHPSNCSVCNAHFPTSMEMWDHKVVTHGIPCEICESLFETEEKLTDHVKSVHLKNESNEEEIGKPNFEDTKDNQDVKSTESGMALNLPTNSQAELVPPLKFQFQITNPKRPYTCHLCPAKVHKKSQIISHWSRMHGLKPKKCNLCKKPFPSKHLTNLHRKAEHEFSCQICSKSFKKRIGLEDHGRQVHGLVTPRSVDLVDTPWVTPSCTICGMVLTTERCLKKHVVNFHSDVPGSIKRCDVCPYTCLTEEDMINHKEKHMTYICPICRIKLPSRGAAQRHRPCTNHNLTKIE